jgi:hypothetical protein
MYSCFNSAEALVRKGRLMMREIPEGIFFINGSRFS